jgi:hypothetical protein
VAADASRRICVSRTSMSADSMKRGSAHQHQDPVSRSGAARMLLIRRGDVRRNRRVTNRFAAGVRHPTDHGPRRGTPGHHPAVRLRADLQR